MSSDTSTLTSGSAAMPLGAAPIAAVTAPHGEEAATVAVAPVPAAAAPATGPPAPTQAPGKEGKKAGGNAIPAALVEAANDIR